MRWGSVPTARRGLPALLVRRGGDRILFDCGEGTQRQLVRTVGLMDLDEIYLTHYHADHVNGLDDLRPFPKLLGGPVPVYCTTEVERRIRQAFAYAFGYIQALIRVVNSEG